MDREEAKRNSTPIWPIEKIIIAEDRHRQDLGDIKALADSIQEVGLLHAIPITPDGKLLAGKRRLEAVKLLGWKDIPVRIVKTEKEEDFLIVERDENFQRKNFAPSEAVTIGLEFEKIERKEAAERQKAARAKPGEKVGAKGGAKLPPPTKGKTRDKVAAAVGMSAKTFQKAKDVVAAAKADPKLAPIVEKMDRTGNVDKAYHEVRSEQAKAEAREMAKTFVPTDNLQLVNGDLREVMAGMEPESVDLIFSDPPYDKTTSVELYGEIARLGAKVLKPEGDLLLYAGKFFLPEILNVMTPHMEYFWVAALRFTGPLHKIQCKSIDEAFRLILWFRKKKNRIGKGCFDLVIGEKQPEKTLHEWQQHDDACRYFLDRLTVPGDVVLDPCMGSGSFVASALGLNRKAIGIEIDKDTFEIAKGRIAEEVANE